MYEVWGEGGGPIPWGGGGGNTGHGTIYIYIYIYIEYLCVERYVVYLQYCSIWTHCRFYIRKHYSCKMHFLCGPRMSKKASHVTGLSGDRNHIGFVRWTSVQTDRDLVFIRKMGKSNVPSHGRLGRRTGLRLAAICLGLSIGRISLLLES